ncbi:MAG: lipopolysaccharide heptosyltransferase II [Waddliaceae bacterium]
MMPSTLAWPKKTPQNIVVRLPNWLGDLVMATPVLADLRVHYPGASITAMCQASICPLISRDPNIDEILCFQRPSGWLHRKRHLEIIEPLRQGNYDLGILLTNSFSSAWWFWRGHVQNRLGYAGHFRRRLLNKAIAFHEKREIQHLVITYKELLHPLGIPVSDTPPWLYLAEREKEDAVELLSRYNIAYGRHTIIGINPGAAFGSAKCWPPDRFEKLTRRLLNDKNTYILYFGDQAGAPLVNDICKNMPDRVVNLSGKTSLRELMTLIQCCSVFLTNDSGPMHIAAALHIPLLALFGSTNEVKTGPFPKGHVIHKHVECSPCYRRICPIDFRCMKKIDVDEVYQKLMSILGEASSLNKKSRGRVLEKNE